MNPLAEGESLDSNRWESSGRRPGRRVPRRLHPPLDKRCRCRRRHPPGERRGGQSARTRPRESSHALQDGWCRQHDVITCGRDYVDRPKLARQARNDLVLGGVESSRRADDRQQRHAQDGQNSLKSSAHQEEFLSPEEYRSIDGLSGDLRTSLSAVPRERTAADTSDPRTLRAGE
jgi:hypothetical protein